MSNCLHCTPDQYDIGCERGRTADKPGWIDHHCYACGGSTALPGQRDMDHILCFVTEDELTPEQAANLRPVYTVERLPIWKQEGFDDPMEWVRRVTNATNN